MTKVRCNVRTCEFWGSGEVCKADEIWVTNNTIGVTADMKSSLNVDDVEFASELIRDTEERMARTSRQTQCETMRPKS